MPVPLQTMLVPQLTPGDLLPPSTQVIAPVAQEVVPFLQLVGLPVHDWPARAADTRARAVADHVGATADAGALRGPVHAHRHAGRARRDAVVADARIARTALPVGARAAEPVAVADLVGTARHAGHDVAGAVDAGRGAGRARDDTALARRRVAGASAARGAGDAGAGSRCRPCWSRSWSRRACCVSSMHVGTPVMHEVTPFVRTPARGFVVHAWPPVHGVHWPFALHTWLAPQPVPASFGVPSTHVCAPVVHVVTPV